MGSGSSLIRNRSLTNLTQVNSRKVLAGLDALGAKYEYHFIDYFAGGQKDADFVKNVNPSATVPAAVDGDLQLTESNAILMYAADVAGNGDSKLYPKDLKQRANINRWLFWEASVWFPSCYIYLIENVAKPELFSAPPDAKTLEAEAPKFAKLASMIDTQLGKTKYVAGDELSIADIAVAACLHLHAHMKLGMEKYPNLQRWMSSMEGEAWWKKTQPAVEEKLVPSKFAKKVRALFNYTRDLEPSEGKLTELYFYEDVNAAGVHEPGDDPREMDVLDGWSRAEEFDLDRQGFCLRDFSPAYDGSWEDDEKVRDQFYPEVVEFLKRQTGAKRVLVFDHTIRTRKNASKKLTQETGTSQRAPVALVHCDYTHASGPKRVRQLLPEEADDLLAKRVAFYNVWKPIAKVEEQPLAMCDVTSCRPEDFFKLYLRYRDRTGENYVLNGRDEHKWWYFPGMEKDQVIVLKTYESDEQRARFVGHSAFTDPTSKPDAPMRESVEIRTFCFF